MKKKITTLLLFITAIFNLTVYAKSETDNELKTKFIELDNIIFEESFNNCHLEALNPIISEDFEFYHDVAGVQHRDSFLKSVKQNICSNMNNKPIRKLVPNTMELFSLKKDGVLYGMIQRGIHEFYIKEKGKPLYKTGIAKFTHLWILEDDKWKLKRVLSFDHQSASD
ncbi:MAG: nuclear transport factor 2 family protein [Kangiellaceae bacterium]|nr:nuclear transport factor 2 family protein [Kangiellaceae bacterium]